MVSYIDKACKKAVSNHQDLSKKRVSGSDTIHKTKKQQPIFTSNSGNYGADFKPSKYSI